MRRGLVRTLALVALAWLVTGCASTTLQSTWRDPAYSGGSVWSATSETMNPTSVQRDAPGFADVILGSMGKDGLLPAAK